MNKLAKSFYILLVYLLSGCAHLDFGDDKGLAYYDSKPYLFVSTTKDCVSTATIVGVPEVKREVKFKSGYGTADLSVALSNGMITSVGQKTDSKIPETITAIASLGTAAKGIMGILEATEKEGTGGTQLICEPTAKLYPIVDGKPDETTPISFSVKTTVVPK